MSKFLKDVSVKRIRELVAQALKSDKSLMRPNPGGSRWQIDHFFDDVIGHAGSKAPIPGGPTNVLRMIVEQVPNGSVRMVTAFPV